MLLLRLSSCIPGFTAWANEVNYAYQYTDSDLQQLARKLSALEKSGCQEAYILLNNISMFEDAKRFAKFMSENY
jgi:uncharacterized protein YecE (DUF72 family)